MSNIYRQDYEPPKTHRSQRRERPAKTMFYRWFPLLVIVVFAVLIMDRIGVL